MAMWTGFRPNVVAPGGIMDMIWNSSLERATEDGSKEASLSGDR